MFRSAALISFILLAFSRIASGQTDVVSEARAAISAGNYARATALLSGALSQNPSADAYLYLGIAYANTRDWRKAENTLKEGSGKYPKDARFYNELAGVYLAANDLEKAKASLQSALAVDPTNKYASDLMATVDISTGNVQAALNGWNKDGRPIVGDILHNSHLEFENWVVRKAVAFEEEKKLTWTDWKTTEARLWASELFSNVGVEIEPTPKPDRYTAVVRTSPKSNGKQQLVSAMLDAVFFDAPSLSWWNFGNTGMSATSTYRYATNRHFAEAKLRTPVPLPGVLFVTSSGLFRSERWDISRPAIDTGVDTRFRFESTGFRIDVKHIPHYRVELGAGFEYRNRTASGSIPNLALDSRNTGKFLFQGSFLPAVGRYRSRIHAEAFLARESFLGDMNYSGGTLEWDNRYVVNPRRGMNAELLIKGGTSRGELPVDDYFVLGIQHFQNNLLRGHDSVSSQGHYGHSPMGTSFVLVNTTLDRRMRRLQLFNTLNVPYVDLKWLIFVDGAKTFDRAHVFEQGTLLIDTGGGLRFETPSTQFDFTYGRSLRDGTAAVAIYAQKRW